MRIATWIPMSSNSFALVSMWDPVIRAVHFQTRRSTTWFFKFRRVRTLGVVRTDGALHPFLIGVDKWSDHGTREWSFNCKWANWGYTPRSQYSHYPFKGGVPSCNRLIDLASTTMEVEILAIFFFKQTAGSWWQPLLIHFSFSDYGWRENDDCFYEQPTVGCFFCWFWNSHFFWHFHNIKLQ